MRHAHFVGGSIFPGLRLMAQRFIRSPLNCRLLRNLTSMACRDGTPGRRSCAGVYHAVCGGVDRLVEEFAQPEARIFLAGGSLELAAGLRCRPEVIGSVLTLEGIRHTAWPDA